MLPDASGIEIADISTAERQTSRTYYLDTTNNTIQGIINNNAKAIKQAIFLALSVDRYDYEMFSWNYGFEVKDLFGREEIYVRAMLPKRITECLLQDDRINSVNNFKMEFKKKICSCSFTVNTIFGNIDIEGVDINV